MSNRAQGVLPDEVIRDPKSNAELLFLTLVPGLGPPQLEAFLRSLTEAVVDLTAGEGADQAATACAGLGKRFFDRTGTATIPAGLL